MQASRMSSLREGAPCRPMESVAMLFGPACLRVKAALAAIESLGQLDPELYPVRYGAEVQRFQVDEQLKRHCEVRDEKSVQMGLVAAQKPSVKARLLDRSDCVADAGRGLSVIVGSGHGPCNEVAICYGAFYQRGPRAVRPTSVPKGMYNSLSSNLSIYFGVTGRTKSLRRPVLRERRPSGTDSF